MVLDRWQKLSIAEQLGHIGSEVSRVSSWRKRGDIKAADLALVRALELLDLTIADKRWQPRLKELARLREVVCDFFQEKPSYKTELASLERYFLNFAIFWRDKP